MSGVVKKMPHPLLGHSTVKMTERYAHLAPENVRAAVARLDGLSRFGHGAVPDKEKAAEAIASTA